MFAETRTGPVHLHYGLGRFTYLASGGWGDFAHQFVWRRYDDTGGFLALGNDEKQHSLWTGFADVPAGWLLIHGEADRASCLDFIEQNGSDIRPLSLRSETWQRTGRRISTV